DAPALLAALDPEEQQTLLLEFQELARAVAAQYEGSVVKATDRGLLICFGYPLVLETPARRAANAGLELLERMTAADERRRRQSPALHLSVRAAIHSDLGVVTGPGDRAESLSIVGQVVRVVDELERLAAPETLVISDDAHRLVQGYFECTNLGPL